MANTKITRMSSGLRFRRALNPPRLCPSSQGAPGVRRQEILANFFKESSRLMK